MQFKIDHYGVAVADIEQGLAQYAALFGYELLRGPYDDPLQQARVAFIGRPGADEATLELVAPLSAGSQVERILAKGVSLYHICYEVPDINAALAHLRKQRCLVVSGPTPAVAYDGRPIAWLYMPNRQLTELVEAPAGSAPRMTAPAAIRPQIDAAIAAGQTGRVLSLLKSYWFAEPSLSVAPFVLDRIAKTPNLPPSVACKVRILRSFTVEPLVPLVRAAAACWGVDATVSLGEFNAYPQEILNPDSELYRDPADLVILAAQTRDLAPELWTRAADLGAEQIDAAVSRVVQDFRTWLQTFRSRCAAHLVVHSLEQPAHPAAGLHDAQTLHGQAGAIRRINEELVKAAAEVVGAHVLDYDGLVARHGRERWFDEKKWLTARLPIAGDCLRYMTDEWIRYLVPLCGKQAKCLVTDLDHTLWGGVIGEDGLNGIKLGAEYPGAGFQSLQRAMLDLSRRGVLLAVCSKNNEADAVEAIANHPAMLLRPGDFSALRINWQDKVQNLREIAAELNIGVDSLVLIDDNPVEREFVREMLPETTVIDIDPEQPLELAAALRACPLFERLELSAEDRQRQQQYAEQRERRALETSAATVEDYYRSLDMRAEFGQADAATRARVAQLTQKTNQLNMTTRRYSEQEIQAFSDDPAARVYWVRVEDRFGDNGIVGVMIARDAGDAWELDTFLMSCRVIGRTIERAMLGTLAEHARQAGKKRIVGRFIPTAKNAPARDIYAGNGFQLVEEQDDGSLWQLDLANTTLAVPEWVSCHFANN